jgi:hypothetical protein
MPQPFGGVSRRPTGAARRHESRAGSRDCQRDHQHEDGKPHRDEGALDDVLENQVEREELVDGDIDGKVLGPIVKFDVTGPQTLRLQTREDGFRINQIVLSSETYYPRRLVA